LILVKEKKSQLDIMLRNLYNFQTGKFHHLYSSLKFTKYFEIKKEAGKLFNLSHNVKGSGSKMVTRAQKQTA
jgi:hypothetical protein